MKNPRHDLMSALKIDENLMSVKQSALVIFIALFGLSFPAVAGMQDQGLHSVLAIIDKAIHERNKADEVGEDETDEERATRQDNAQSTLVNLSKTLGTLSYSRLQCGQADVLAEFTQRVQASPEEARNAMRDAFQEGFDKSQKESVLLSADECKRLTESRMRDDDIEDSNVATEETTEKSKIEEVVEEEPEEDPKDRFLRVAELTGQLAYKHKFCEDEKVFKRDFNQYINSVPEEYRADVKKAYWEGYQHGKRLNKNLTRSQCP